MEPLIEKRSETAYVERRREQWKDSDCSEDEPTVTPDESDHDQQQAGDESDESTCGSGHKADEAHEPPSLNGHYT